MSDQYQTIVSHVMAKPGKSKFVKKELLKLMAYSRAEEGCINYDVLQDNYDESVFVVYENWANTKVWQKHMENTYLASFIESTDDVTQNIKSNEMTAL